jgi:hypothetical protein
LRQYWEWTLHTTGHERVKWEHGHHFGISGDGIGRREREDLLDSHRQSPGDVRSSKAFLLRLQSGSDSQRSLHCPALLTLCHSRKSRTLTAHKKDASISWNHMKANELHVIYHVIQKQVSSTMLH